MYKVLLEIYVGILIGFFPKLYLILSIYSINFLLNIENLFQFRDTNILLFADFLINRLTVIAHMERANSLRGANLMSTF